MATDRPTSIHKGKRRSPLPVREPFPELNELLVSIGEAGRRIAAIDASEGAAELLLGRIAGDPDAAGQDVVLPFKLIIRRSSAAPLGRDLAHA